MTQLPGKLVYAGFADREHGGDEWMIRCIELEGHQLGVARFGVYQAGTFVIDISDVRKAYAVLREVGAFPSPDEPGPRGD